MKNSGNELNDVPKIKDLTFFNAENELHFARKMMPNYAPKRAKMLHFAKNELQLFSPQAPQTAVAGGLHEARPQQKASNTEATETSSQRPRRIGYKLFLLPRALCELFSVSSVLGFSDREFTVSKIVGTNSPSLLESVKLEKNELKTNSQ